MNCPNCGAQLAEGAKFCVGCGASVAAAPVNPAPAQAAAVNVNVNGFADKVTASVNKATKKNFKKPVVLGACAAILALIIVIIVLIVSAATGAYKKPINNYINGINKGNADKIVSAFCPVDEADKDLYKFAEKLADGDYKYEVKIYDKHKIAASDRYDYVKASALSEFLDEDEYNKVKEAYKVVVHFEVNDDGDKSCYASEIVVGKYKGKWYILSGVRTSSSWLNW